MQVQIPRDKERVAAMISTRYIYTCFTVISPTSIGFMFTLIDPSHHTCSSNIQECNCDGYTADREIVFCEGLVNIEGEAPDIVMLPDVFQRTGFSVTVPPEFGGTCIEVDLGNNTREQLESVVPAFVAEYCSQMTDQPVVSDFIPPHEVRGL